MGAWDWLLGRSGPVERVDPIDGTNISLWNDFSSIPSWWAMMGGSPIVSPQLASQVWVADRCIQMNAQQIAGMPLKFEGGDEPAWVSAPDPNWFPNGIGDAMHAIVDQLYRYGFSCQYVTDLYANGLPRTWTVLDSSAVNISLENGARAYKLGDNELDPRRVVQVDRNPGLALHGRPALWAYGQVAYSLLAAQNQSLSVSQGATPKFYLQSVRKIDKAQGQAIQTQWMEASTRRNGAPPVIPPELEPKEMSFDPADMALLDTQKWNAEVIATAFGVPSVLLNMALQGGLTYQNPGALGEMWWRFELRPMVTKIVNAFSAQLLPRGQWVWSEASDTFAPLTEASPEDDPQLSQVAKASPAQQPTPLRPVSTSTGGGG